MNTFFPNPETPFSLPSCSDVTLGQTASGEEEFGDKEKEPGPGNALTLQSRAVHHSQALQAGLRQARTKQQLLDQYLKEAFKHYYSSARRRVSSRVNSSLPRVPPHAAGFCLY